MALASLDHRGFVLFSMPRTGSNMLVSLLKSHPDVMCLPAIFSGKGWTDWSKVKKGPKADKVHRLATLPARWSARKQRIADMPELLESLLDLYDDRRVLGFKQHMNAPRDAATRKVVAQRWPAIILTRANVLASYSSNKLVKATGEGAVRAGETPTRAETHFDAAEFERYLNRRTKSAEHWAAKIAGSGAPSMRIEYCDARAPGGLKPIAGFLGLDPAGFGDPGTAKRNSDDILSRFRNPEDAEAWLRANGRTEWAVEE